jgi:regulator of sigma E protease
MISPRVPVMVLQVPDSSPSFRAGLTPGDRIIKVGDVPTEFYDQYTDIVKDKKKGDSVILTVKRSGSQEVLIHTAMIEDGMVGFGAPIMHEQFDSMGVYSYQVKKYGFFAAIPAGVRRTGDELGFYVDQFKKILSPSTGAYKGVGGFKAMGSVFSGRGWDWEHFWTITALFSIILAFMNLLPIPALDGGHVLFTLVEMVTGRKPSEKFLEYAQIVGMVLLLALMVYANGNDWFGWGR